MKFRLLHGRHMEAGHSFDGRGDKKPIIESDAPLDEVFMNKFLQVDESLPAANGKPMRTPAKKDREVNAKAKLVAEKEAQAILKAEKEANAAEGPVITLKAVHKGRGRWDVVQVMDGVVTDECVNDEFLNKADAKDMEEAGYQPEDDS